MSDDVLIHYAPTQPSHLCTHRSAVANVVILLQKAEESFRPIAFASRLLRGALKDYGISDQEFLSIIFGFEKFRQYLVNININI